MRGIFGAILVVGIFTVGVTSPSIANAVDGRYSVQSNIEAVTESGFAGGEGTAQAPFLISTAEHLNNI